MAKIIELPPIKESTQDYDKMEKRIIDLFRKMLYAPLMRALSVSSNKIKNAKSNLYEALSSGKVTYSDGAFRGEFNASLSKELRAMGAKWDSRISAFKIVETEMPYDVRINILTSQSNYAAHMALIDQKLAAIAPEEFASILKTADLFDSALFKIETQFQKNVSKITVSPQLTKEQRAKIADEWQNNMDLWIKDFTEKQIKDLRQTVFDSTLSGNRRESLVKGIQKSYGVTERKAKFLAKQETSLMMAKFKESRYTAAGVDEYRWYCVKMPHDKSPDQHTPGNVRYAHGILEGQIFRWDTPPVTDEKGKRNNPGQDYNCRCFGRPLLRVQ